jgi:hypothetical protein
MRKAKRKVLSVYSFLISWFSKYLPAASRALIMRENERLRAESERLEAENEELRAYVRGMEAGLRSIRKIVINNETGKEARK